VKGFRARGVSWSPPILFFYIFIDLKKHVFPVEIVPAVPAWDRRSRIVTGFGVEVVGLVTAFEALEAASSVVEGLSGFLRK